MLVHTGMYWYVHVPTGRSMYRYREVYYTYFLHINVLHIFPTHKSCWNIRIQTGTCQDVHSGALSYCLVPPGTALYPEEDKAV